MKKPVTGRQLPEACWWCLRGTKARNWEEGKEAGHWEAVPAYLGGRGWEGLGGWGSRPHILADPTGSAPCAFLGNTHKRLFEDAGLEKRLPHGGSKNYKRRRDQWWGRRQGQWKKDAASHDEAWDVFYVQQEQLTSSTSPKGRPPRSKGSEIILGNYAFDQQKASFFALSNASFFFFCLEHLLIKICLLELPNRLCHLKNPSVFDSSEI